MSDRWATFDCYGTLVDWEGGMAAALGSVVGDRAAAVLDTYYAVEPVVQGEGFRPYRDVLAEALGRAASEHGFTLDATQRDVLGATLPTWPVFADTAPALRELRARGWRLAILSNVDRDLVERTIPQLGTDFDLVITSQDVRSYKPGLAHFDELRRRSGVAPGRWVHVACSLLHDVGPADALGVPVVWIDRVQSPPDPRPAATLPDLRTLPDTLAQLT
jgi:2-haloacid dehalogenase